MIRMDRVLGILNRSGVNVMAIPNGLVILTFTSDISKLKRIWKRVRTGWMIQTAMMLFNIKAKMSKLLHH